MTRCQPLALTLVDASKIHVRFALLIGGVCLTTVAAQVQIPWQPVPFTLQTLAVLTCGLVLGSRLGAMSQGLYLAAGALGAPVFAGFRAGLGGPTSGYLVAFVAAAWLMGWFAERGWDRNVLGTLAALAIAQAFVLVFGTAWLGLYLDGFRDAWKVGAAPFLVGEAMKSAVIIFGLPGTWKLIGAKKD